MTTVRHCSFFLTFLISETFFFITPNHNCPEHMTTNSGLFTFALAVLFSVQDRFRKLRTIPEVREATRPRIGRSGPITPTSRCLCPSHVGHSAIVCSTSSSGAAQNQHLTVSSLSMRAQYEPTHAVTREDLSETIGQDSVTAPSPPLGGQG